MYLADTHMHSTVSFDGHDARLDMTLASQAAGLDAICFTDHYDIVNEKSEFVPHYDWGPARAQQAELGPLNAIQVLYGLELGNATADWAGAEEALREPGLDFVIGSIHNASKPLNWLDYYFVDYAKEPSLAEAHLEDYFRQLGALARWGKFDSLGHLPYPLRYIRGRDGLERYLSAYREQYLDTLRLLAEQGKAVEMNTNRGREDYTDYRTLLLDWKSVGGELVTVGADAHRKEHVGLGIAQAYDLLRDCGFRYVTVFRSRTPEAIKL